VLFCTSCQLRLLTTCYFARYIVISTHNIGAEYYRSLPAAVLTNAMIHLIVCVATLDNSYKIMLSLGDGIGRYWNFLTRTLAYIGSLMRYTYDAIVTGQQYGAHIMSESVV